MLSNFSTNSNNSTCNSPIHSVTPCNSDVLDCAPAIARGADVRSTASANCGGLSTAHICGKVEAWEGGSLVKVTRSKPSGFIGRKGGGKRGKAQFSRGSRRRLMRTLAKIEKTNLPVFVTLTYPGEWVDQPEAWKRHLKNWIARLIYRFPAACGVWRLEFQKRGAPHYHLLIWGVSYQDLRQFASLAWFQVVGSGDERHLRAGTQVARLHSWRGVMAYASKYLGKVDGDPGQNVGRHWGAFARPNLPWAQMSITELTDRQAKSLIRYLRHYAHIGPRMFYSLTVFVCNPSRWLELSRIC